MKFSRKTPYGPQFYLRYAYFIKLGWLIFSIYTVSDGADLLHQYSTPGILGWLDMVPEYVTYAKILLGLMAIVNCVAFYQGHDLRITLPFTIVLCCYIVIDFVPVNSEMLLFRVSNLLFLVLAVLTLKKRYPTLRIPSSEWRNWRTITFVMIGLIPYPLSHWITYSWWSFLH